MKLKFVLMILIAINWIDNKGFSQIKNKVYKIAGYNVEFIGDLQGFALDVKNQVIEAGVEVTTLRLKHSSGAVPPKFSLKWTLPSKDVAGYWGTSSFLDKTIRPNWAPSSVRSMLAKDAPVVCLYSHDDINKLNFSVSEALNTIMLSTSIKEEDGFVHQRNCLFSRETSQVEHL